MNTERKKVMKKNEIENNQICYCEKYGIIESVTKKEKMIYYSSYPSEHCTYKIIVDLKKK